MKDNSYKRHIAKAITWRAVGTIDTILLSWLITGDPYTGLKIGFAEVVTKMILYYVHERLWFKASIEAETKEAGSRKRHLAKTFSWRAVGTLDTMLLAWLISGSPVIGVQIGVVEVVTKMVLYYFHERAWYKMDYGLAASRGNTSVMSSGEGAATREPRKEEEN